ncbi:Ger(x)C family spore germination protein [Paenibacillus thermotolerans]|uniref:Ger(x)C family spore germination protein n=1 Tax=Paenibacillus thermotolerans TaxID=3027807 RepID=UPI00236764F7|nr:MULTISPECIES: Ger(x)C family spore germination protein [unclassified Paenibacillus]
MKQLRNALLFPLLAFMLSGCWGAKEIEHMIYANSIGFDYEGGKVVLYIQMISFSGIAKREQGSESEEQKIYIGKAQGDTVDGAFFNLYASSQQRIAWSHVRSLVFSEAALKKGIVNEALDVFDRYYEFRYTVWTWAAKDPIEEIFATPSNVQLSVLYSKLNNPSNAYEQSSVAAPLYLYKFIWQWKEKADTTLLPYLQIVHDNWMDNKERSPKLRTGGVCFLQSKELKGCLPRRHILGLRWLNEKTVRAHVSLKNGDSKGGSLVAMFTMEEVKPEIIPELEGGRVRFKIKVSASGSLPS